MAGELNPAQAKEGEVQAGVAKQDEMQQRRLMKVAEEVGQPAPPREGGAATTKGQENELANEAVASLHHPTVASANEAQCQWQVQAQAPEQPAPPHWNRYQQRPHCHQRVRENGPAAHRHPRPEPVLELQLQLQLEQHLELEKHVQTDLGTEFDLPVQVKEQEVLQEWVERPPRRPRLD